MKDFCIVGSGIAGSTIANLLSKKYTIEVFDKARGVGGRASSRRFKDEANFDHGTQYLNPKNNAFKKFLKILKKKKVVKEWPGKHFDLCTIKKNHGIKLIGQKANNSISKYLLKKIKVNHLSKVIKIIFINNIWEITTDNKKKKYFRNLILTCPYPQLKPLAASYLPKDILNLNVKMQPNITVMAVFKDQEEIPVSSLRFNDSIIGWAANENSKKRFKSKLSLWTLQSTNKWDYKFIDKYKKNKRGVANIVIERFLALTNYDKRKLIFVSIHGWKFSYNLNRTKFKSCWVKKYNLGVCGDWFLGPKVEHAWLSANNLFNQIKKNPPEIDGF